MTSDTDDLEQQLRQNLKLRRELGAEVAKAKTASSAKLGGGRLLGSAVGAAETASHNDDLGELRRELKVRRELGTEVAKAKDNSTKQAGGVAYGGGGSMSRFLITIGRIWLYVAAFLILLSYVSILVDDGFGELAAILSPFNVWNWLAVVITFLPGIGLLELGKKLDRRGP
jgi:chorismate mutase